MAPFDFRNPSSYDSLPLGPQPPQVGPDGMTEEERQYLALYQALMSQAQQPPPPMGLGQQIGGALQQFPGPQARWSPLENLASGFARGMGQGLSLRGERKQQEQALKNQRNLAATAEVLQARAKRLGEKPEPTLERIRGEAKAREQGVRDVTPATIPGASPSAFNAMITPTDKEAKLYGLTPGKPVTMAEYNARRESYSSMKPKDERLVQIMGPNGAPIWVPESEARGKPAAQAARAVTGVERQALSYYNRAKDADASANELEPIVSGAGLAGQTQLQYAPNIFKTSEQRRYRQAQRAFTEARLRKESGAAIPLHEVENDSRTYFAQPGDDPATLEQKRLKRQTVLDGLAYSAGRAYEEYYGEPMIKLGAPQNRTTTGAPADSVLMQRGGKTKLVPRGKVEQMRRLGAKEVR